MSKVEIGFWIEVESVTIEEFRNYFQLKGFEKLKDAPSYNDTWETYRMKKDVICMRVTPDGENQSDVGLLFMDLADELGLNQLQIYQEIKTGSTEGWKNLIQ